MGLPKANACVESFRFDQAVSVAVPGAWRTLGRWRDERQGLLGALRACEHLLQGFRRKAMALDHSLNEILDLGALQPRQGVCLNRGGEPEQEAQEPSAEP
jgi:hypothetical protein